MNTGRTRFKKGINAGKNHPKWKGGKPFLAKSGYVMVWSPGHPKATNNRICEHIIIMEKHLGRYLKNGEVVHHLNCIRNDNRIENLIILNKKIHDSYHTKRRWAELRDKFPLNEVKEQYLTGKYTLQFLGKKYNLNPDLLGRRLRALGVNTKRNYWFYQTKSKNLNLEKIINEYVIDKMSTVEIGKKYNVSSETIGNKLKNAGISIRHNPWFYRRKE
jgi:hypothetical protein